MKHLTQRDKEQYARFLDRWVKTWARNKEKGNYNDLWNVFRQMKESGIENNSEFKQLGGFGLYLLNVILFSFQEYNEEDMREEGESHLIECVITLHLLTDYLHDELKTSKVRKKFKTGLTTDKK